MKSIEIILEGFDISPILSQRLKVLLNLLLVNEQGNTTILSSSEVSILTMNFLDSSELNPIFNQKDDFSFSMKILKKRWKILFSNNILNTYFVQFTEHYKNLFEEEFDPTTLKNYNQGFLFEPNSHLSFKEYLNKKEKLSAKFASNSLALQRLSSEFSAKSFEQISSEMELLDDRNDESLMVAIPEAVTMSAEERKVFSCMLMLATGIRRKQYSLVFANLKELDQRKIFVYLLTEIIWNVFTWKGWNLLSLTLQKDAFYQCLILKMVQSLPEKFRRSLAPIIELLENTVFKSNFFDTVLKEKLNEMKNSFVFKNANYFTFAHLQSEIHLEKLLEVFYGLETRVSLRSKDASDFFKLLAKVVFKIDKLTQNECFAISSRRPDLKNTIDSLTQYSEMCEAVNKLPTNIISNSLLEGVNEIVERTNLKVFIENGVEEIVVKQLIFPLSFLLLLHLPKMQLEIDTDEVKTREFKKAFRTI